MIGIRFFSVDPKQSNLIGQSFLDLENAVTIGLPPYLPRERFFYIGNSSLMGSYMALVSQEFLKNTF
ncbi:MAG: ATP-binding protein [Proteobacteria bacterium]|nr:ATP-binding protein [Pseudomonadota bacterium]